MGRGTPSLATILGGSAPSGEILPIGPEFAGVAVSGFGDARQVLAEGKGDINNVLKNINLLDL